MYVLVHCTVLSGDIDRQNFKTEQAAQYQVGKVTANVIVIQAFLALFLSRSPPSDAGKVNHQDHRKKALKWFVHII